MAQVVETKKWYESKIFYFALTLILVAGGNLLFGFLSVRVTPEQMSAIEAAYPQAVEVITRLQNGESIFSVLSLIVGIAITVARASTK
jgi:hypothetical protein